MAMLGRRGGGAARMLLGVALLCAVVAYSHGQACPSECSSGCSLDILSDEHPNPVNAGPGKYFNFDLPAGCSILDGNTYTVNQYRGGAPIWTGDVIVWLNQNPASTAGSSGGRRNPLEGVALGQWEVGDRICVGCASNCPSEAGRCGPKFGSCRCTADLPYCNTENGWCGTGDAHRNAQCGVQFDYGTEGQSDDCGGSYSDRDCERGCGGDGSDDDSGTGFDVMWLVYLSAVAIPVGFLAYTRNMRSKTQIENIIPSGPTAFVALPPGRRPS